MRFPTISLDHEQVRRRATTLAIAMVGGLLFAWLKLPLAWILGSMSATTLAALLGVKLAAWDLFRNAMVCVLGVMIGSSFSPSLISALPQWAGAICVLAVHLSVISTVGYFFFRRVARFDPMTAFFSAAPGGLLEMSIQAERWGGDTRAVSLVQAARILVVVATVPFYFRVIRHLHVPTLPPSAAHGAFTITESLVLLGCAAGGYALARQFRIPSPAFFGPLFLSSLVHLTGVSHIAPPPTLVAAAQVVLGAGIGLRFMGARVTELTGIVLYGMASSLVMIGLGIVTAYLSAPLLGLQFEAMLLSLVPGGLSEMSVIALTMGLQTAFVSTMHFARLIAVVMGAPVMARVLSKASAFKG